MIPMKDGVRLVTDVYMLEEEGPWPVVLIRTEYLKGNTKYVVDENCLGTV